MDDDPVDWPCMEDRLKAYLEQHPQCDVEDARFALIWGEENDDENE